MKKTYISPNTEVVELTHKANLLFETSNTQAAEGTEGMAPSLPGISDDELFQFFMIH